MTRKEKLYQELLNAKNRFYALSGSELIGYDVNSQTFKVEASNSKLNDISNDIIYWNRKYDNFVLDLKRKAYFASEEGKALKESLENRNAEINKQVHEILDLTESKLDEVIKLWLGEEWAVVLRQNTLEIGLQEGVYDSGHKKFYFGLTFDVRFDRWGNKEPKFEFSHGCMNGFSIKADNADELRMKHLIGIGTFLSNRENMDALYKILSDFSSVYDALTTESWEIGQQLSNPKIPKDFMEVV